MFLRKQKIIAVIRMSEVARVLKLIRTEKITLPELLECMRFYLTAYGERRLLATLPRSGHHWATLMLAVAKDIAEGGEGDYTYATEIRDWPIRLKLLASFDWRTPIRKRRYKDLPSMFIFHTHWPYERIVLLQKERMKVVILVRNLFDQLQSRLFHSGYDINTQDAFIQAGYVGQAIDFCNSWGAFLEKHPNSRLLRYEDLVENPVETIVSLSDFWELELPRDCISKAVERCTREKMLQRVPANEVRKNPRVSPRRRGRSVFTQQNLDFIMSQIKHMLHYNFGYDYEAGGARYEAAPWGERWNIL